jgi:hypothetical protein
LVFAAAARYHIVIGAATENGFYALGASGGTIIENVSLRSRILSLFQTEFI